MPPPAAYQMFERSRDLVVAARFDGQVVYANPAATRVLASPTAWSACFPEAVRELAREALREAERGAPSAFEWTLDQLSFSAEVAPTEDGVLCISRDHSALKRSEERARRSEKMLVDTQGVAHLGTWEWDISEPTATWSDELYRIYGLTPETYTPSYEAYLTMVHPDDRARVVEATNRVFKESVPYSHDERIFRPDGTVRHLHTWAFPLHDRDGKLTHLIGVCQDITDRALAEEALQRANAVLETRVAERTRELEAFNTMVSHDLRSPLAVIQMAAELLAKDVPPSSQVLIERIRRTVSNMSALMDNLLTFARVSETSVQVVEVDVTAMAHDIADELRVASDARTAVFAIEDGLRVTGDHGLFRIALSNLLANAWKYTERRDETRIEVGMCERDGARVLFIRDNGIGFDSAQASDLFEPFRRLQNAAGFRGTGVGLAIVRRILQRHGATITAESTLGEGATFFIRMR